MSYRFQLDDAQIAAFEAWIGNNDQALAAEGKRMDGGAIGGRFTFAFTNTSLGTVVKVTDCLTKTELDLSDYENW